MKMVWIDHGHLLSIFCLLWSEGLAVQRCYRVYSRAEGKFTLVNYTIDAGSYEDAAVSHGAEPALESGILGRAYRRTLDDNQEAPDWSTPEECARKCTAGEPPKICKYHWTVEYYRTLGSACELCKPSTNISLPNGCQCILADGVEVSGIMVINRMYPGPPIQVCAGDLVIVDVTNHAFGSTLSIHFHGIYQYDYQYYDGVPFVTQCPIAYSSTFRYKWRAQNPGTHFYHAHTGLHKPAGIEGALIVRNPEDNEINRRQYDEDRLGDIIFINDWFHSNPVNHWPGTDVRNPGQVPDNFLINGRGQWFNSTENKTTDIPLTVFNVEPNHRYRFRMINSQSWTCPSQLTIQDHNITLIATDGDDIVPKNLTTITSFAGERYDFVLQTNQKVGSYWIQLRGLGRCELKKIVQYAIIRYNGLEEDESEMERYTYDRPLPLGIIVNNVNVVCDEPSTDDVCVKDLRSAKEVHEGIRRDKADITLYIPVSFYRYTDEELFMPNTYKNFEVPFPRSTFASMLQNISNEFTGSPYLTQMRDIAPERICNGDNLPEKCEKEKPCFCSHIIDIPLHSVVEIVMVEYENGAPHPFHLHGYGFHVMGQGTFTGLKTSGSDNETAINLDKAGLLKRNFDRPPIKDTFATPANGYTIVRFLANNPGYWLYHCHFESHQLSGMELAFHVGQDSDLPPIPHGFPRCGDFTPPIWETEY